MRVTERQLRSVISNVISEMSPEMGAMMPMASMSGQGDDYDMSSFMNKAAACRNMDVASLFDMCAKICGKNPSQASHCAELCACVCRKDDQGCCRCLAEICKCSHCAQVCFEYCGC